MIRKMRRYKKYIAGIILIAAIFGIFKFMDRDTGEEDLVTNEEVTKTVKKETAKEEKDIKTQDLIIFVPDDTNTSLEERHVTLSNSNGKSTIELLMDALRDDGKTKSSYNKPIPSSMTVNSAYKKGDTVYVDFKSKGIKEDPAQESLILDSLVLTMTTLEGVEKVRVQVDGENTDKFMGTFDISEPLTLRDVTNNVKYMDEKVKDSEKDEKKDEESEKTEGTEKSDEDSSEDTSKDTETESAENENSSETSDSSESRDRESSSENSENSSEEESSSEESTEDTAEEEEGYVERPPQMSVGNN